MKKKLSLIYKIIIAVVSSIGLYLNFEIFTIKGGLIYYTIQSNLMCFLFYIAIVILYLCKKLKKNNIYYLLKGLVTMAMVTTMIVYQFFLSTEGAYVGHELTSMLVHLVLPLLVIFDYIIFGEKGNLKSWHPFIWSFTLIFYLIFDIIYVFLGGKFHDVDNYPYFFLNVDKYGIDGIILNCSIIYILFLLLGKLVQIVDQKIKKVK